MCPEKETGRPCELGDLLQFKVSFGGQIGVTVGAGNVSSGLRAQVGPVIELTVNKDGTTPRVSGNEISVEASWQFRGQGGKIKGDIAAPAGNRVQIGGASDVTGGSVGSQQSQNARGPSKVTVAFGAALMFGFELNYSAARELLLGPPK